MNTPEFKKGNHSPGDVLFDRLDFKFSGSALLGAEGRKQIAMVKASETIASVAQIGGGLMRNLIPPVVEGATSLATSSPSAAGNLALDMFDSHANRHGYVSIETKIYYYLYERKWQFLFSHEYSRKETAWVRASTPSYKNGMPKGVYMMNDIADVYLLQKIAAAHLRDFKAQHPNARGFLA